MSSLFVASQVPEDLQPYVDAGVVEMRDLRVVSSLFNMAGLPRTADPLVWVALALVIATPRSGHTCVDFGSISMWGPTGESDATVEWVTDPNVWLAALSSSPELVCNEKETKVPPRRPFVLWGTRLYAARAFDEEAAVAAQLLGAIKQGRVTVITGGPGSGKTTEVARRIVELVAAGLKDDSLALAAPTGLAAKRMDRALRAAVRRGINEGTVSAEVEKVIDDLPKMTVHKLLKFNPAAKVQWRHNTTNNMPYGTVIIDEVSMMSLAMMSRVFDALKPDAQLVLVGDPFQLASVDAGTVLADIVVAADAMPGFVTPMPGMFRFPQGSPVADISEHTKSGNLAGALKAIRRHNGASGDARFSWVDPASDDAGLQQVARTVVEHARQLCELASVARTDADYRKILEFRDSLQVVCAHRRGNLGVSGWNSAVERQLGQSARGQWYPGRPVMVTSNDPASKLSNGDIGVVCRDEKGSPVVVFGDAEGVTVLPVSRVPKVETVHALTIHKSQGSEFGHTIVVLPAKKSRILTRELLYTGMTRAKPHLTLVATEAALEAAVNTRVQRATGLADRL